jgi:hypothetical protein
MKAVSIVFKSEPLPKQFNRLFTKPVNGNEQC